MKLTLWCWFGSACMWLYERVPCRVTWSMWLVANRGVARAMGRTM